MQDYRKTSLSLIRFTAHIVWVIKYIYHVLKGDVQIRFRDLIVQICNSEDVKILKGVVSKDYVHMHIEYSPSLNVSVLVKK
jgi:putative transposase